MSTALILWVSLALPSLYIVQRYAGWPGTLVYAACAAAGAVFRHSIPAPRSPRGLAWMATSTVVAVFALFLAIYPRVNVHTPDAGSDDDDGINMGAWSLLSGHSPYAQQTYQGNALHHLPGAFMLAVPFVLAGTSALQNVFWLTMFFLAVAKETGDGRLALRFAWLVLALSPTVLHQVANGTSHASNTIYVVLGLWWLARTPHRDVAALAWGVALSSRPNFLLLVPLAYGWLRQQHGWRTAARAMAITCGVVACLTVPFYLHSPGDFGPLEAAARLTRFDEFVPYAGEAMIGLMGTLAVVLSLVPMSCSMLFYNCAIVQATPVVIGTGLATLFTGAPDLPHAAYGVFAAWFALMAIAIDDKRRMPDSPRVVLPLYS